MPGHNNNKENGIADKIAEETANRAENLNVATLSVSKSAAILFYPIALEGPRGTIDEFAIIPFRLVLFSAAIVDLAQVHSFHSLILSSHRFFCLTEDPR